MLLGKIGNTNAKGEYYLTDIVEVARAHGGRQGMAIVAPEDELAGCNTRAETGRARSTLAEAPPPRDHAVRRDHDCPGNSLSVA